MHFAFNMLVLHIYGDNIENYLGRTKYIIFYFLGGLAAAFFQAIFSRGLDVPMIGASGCIAGIMGAYFVLYPKARINVFMWFIIFIQTIKVPASIVIGFWIITQLINATGSSSDGVAYFAHIGGFVFGYVVCLFSRLSACGVCLSRWVGSICGQLLVSVCVRVRTVSSACVDN